MFRDKASIKSKITARVITLDDEGLRKLEALREKYPGPGWRSIPEYVAESDKIHAEHGTLKMRESFSLKRLLQAIWATRFRWKDIIQVMTYEMAISHNIVTDQGDALIVDMLVTTGTQTAVDNTNGHIEVGTGWTGTTPKQNEVCNTSVAVEVMDATYPKQKGAFGAANDNVAQYRATFEAGEAEATDLDEAALLNNITPASADCMAYGNVTPNVTVGASDTLQVDWEHTYTGA